nr:DMT family transporter [uncultured Bacillus sp.]
MQGKAKLITAMLIFGSIGVFVKHIDLSSSEIALLRGVIGSVFLLSVSLLKKKFSFKGVKGNLVLLLLSGAAIGFNWIFLFEAYRYTTISNATISYYFAPILVMALAPFILREKLTLVKAGSIIVAMIGLFLTANNGDGSNGMYHHTVGIVYGLLAATLYASVILMNKFIKNMSDYEITVIQLMMASIVLVPYVYVKDSFSFSGLDGQSIVLILILGMIHTGLAYYLYFGSIKELKGQTIAILSYIDPIFAVMIAAVLLGESMTVQQMVGGILILGSTFLSGKEENRRYPDKKCGKCDDENIC